MAPQPGGPFWRFSLGEVLVAVAIDAVLVATILDWVRLYAAEGPPPYVCYAMLAVTFLVFPGIIVPVYFASYREVVRGFRDWHSRRNDVLMGLDLPIVVASIVVFFMNDTNRTRHVQVIAAFVPITYTMYLCYRLIVDYLKRGRRVLEPARDETVAVAPAGADPDVGRPDASGQDQP